MTLDRYADNVFGMKRKNPIAVALGKMAKGKPKIISDEERKIRSKRLEVARKNRWTDKTKKNEPDLTPINID